jgi:micrococcal nuclease
VTPPPWTYRARCLRVIDGDTLAVQLDLGFDVHKDETLRLAGVDTPERYTAAGKEVTQQVEAWLRAAPEIIQWPLLISTAKTDKYGRYIAVVADAVTDRPTLNDWLLATGMARPYPTPKPARP